MTIDNIDLTKFKYCECNCGELISIIGKKGKPIRFKKGHSGRLRVGNKNPCYKEGKRKCNGYLQILKPNHPYSNKKGYVYEHRLVMEEYIGRYLDPKEIVHHKDKNRLNNKIENLQLFSSNGKHLKEELKINVNNICLLCNSNTTTITKEGWSCWYRYKDGYICMKCYKKDYRKKQKIK